MRTSLHDLPVSQFLSFALSLGSGRETARSDQSVLEPNGRPVVVTVNADEEPGQRPPLPRLWAAHPSSYAAIWVAGSRSSRPRDCQRSLVV